MDWGRFFAGSTDGFYKRFLGCLFLKKLFRIFEYFNRPHFVFIPK